MQGKYNIQAKRAKKRKQGEASSSCVRIGLLFGSLVLALGLVLIPGFINNYNTGLIDTQLYTSQTSKDGDATTSKNPVVRNGVVSTFGKHE